MPRPDEAVAAREIAPAKLNLALHVRGRRADGRHDIETVFAFCTDGDRLSAVEGAEIGLTIGGPFARDLGTADNLILKAAHALAEASGCGNGAAIHLDKRLPVASGIGGGSADAGAALRLLTSLWGVDPRHAVEVAPKLGSDVPACLLSLPMRGKGAGDILTPVELGEISGTPVLLANPGIPLSTAAVFARWDRVDCGPLDGWREGRNDLEAAAIALVPAIGDVLDWLGQCEGATCFALFEGEVARDLAEAAVPDSWWRLATFLR
ncbi:MAG: 4-(cytidine 5'-diphospho)-2-C-methyl-D-erythritol kinase [Sphingomicrobium sp.]